MRLNLWFAGRPCLLALLTLFCQSVTFAQGTAFTYQGRLTANGAPASGIYDFRFALYGVAAGGAPIGGPLTNSAMTVTAGVFMVTLDFGAAFDGNPRWLDISVRTNGTPTFSALTPRQSLTPSPYAILAGDITPANTNIARVNTSQTFSGALNFSNPSNTFAGTLTGAFFDTPARLTNSAPFAPLVWQTAPAPVLAYNTFEDYPSGPATNVLSATNLLAVANRWLTNGLWAAGFRYIWIDDGWSLPLRDANGNLVANPTLYPNSMPALVTSLHQLGFKVGIYISSGTEGTGTCFGYPGTPIALMEQDMNLFASWGIDGVKVDTCGDGAFPAEALGQPPHFRAAANAIVQSGRPMVLDFTVESGGWNNTIPIYWEVPYLMNVWPETGTFDGISGMSNCVWAATYTWSNSITPYSGQLIGPGHYANWGNLNLNATDPATFQAYFSMLGITSCSGFLYDVSRNPSLLTYMTNLEVMAINQDPAAICGALVYSNNLAEVWVKPLGSRGSGTNAVALVNFANANQNVVVNWSLLGLPANTPVGIRDLWAQNTLGTAFTAAWTNSVPANSVQLFKVWANNLNLSLATLTVNNGIFSAPYTVTNSTDSTFGFGAGLLRWDTNYLYVSVGTNLWKRVALSSW
jgi:hypothetical protein